MREIKFRGKRIDNGEWAYGCLTKYSECMSYICEDLIADKTYQVRTETVGQYTGRKDSNEKEIYEGGIIKITFDTSFSEKSFYIGQVEFKSEEGYPAFDLTPWIDCEMNALSWLASNCDPSVLCYEVIGNIHDNPELIE
jgi:uncharacterized phage protein (TIGR01671 family)